MKKILLVVLVVTIAALNTSSYAQKGYNTIGVGPDVCLPMSDWSNTYKPSIGVYAKGMLGVGKTGQVTFTTGYISFKEQGTWDDFTTTLTLLPILIGYRANFNGFYVEPQLGFGLYGTKVRWLDDGEIETASTTAFTWAANVGYVFNKKIEVSARYQTGKKEGIPAGQMIGLRLGYNFSLGGLK